MQNRVIGSFNLFNQYEDVDECVIDSVSSLTLTPAAMREEKIHPPHTLCKTSKYRNYENLTVKILHSLL